MKPGVVLEGGDLFSLVTILAGIERMHAERGGGGGGEKRRGGVVAEAKPRCATMLLEGQAGLQEEGRRNEGCDWLGGWDERGVTVESDRASEWREQR